ncbi:MAG TPA: hypothetical protein VFK23_08460 [Nitrospirota bacterium]|nr:hypothetical protein [Nitrospirota bacterium]
MARGISKMFLSILATVLLSTAVFEGVSAALPNAASHYPGQASPRAGANERDVSQMIRILESRIGSHRMPAQTKEKLATMSEKEFRLVEALCYRIARSGDSPESDLALLLAAALVVLS